MSKRFCQACHDRLAEGIPPYFVDGGRGEVFGPYHPGCADDVVRFLRAGIHGFPYPDRPIGDIRSSPQALTDER